MGTFKLADGVTIADERELRQLARPEEWCGVESMTAGLMRLSRLGLDKHDRLAALPFDRLQLATEQLSPPEVAAPPPPPLHHPSAPTHMPLPEQRLLSS